MAGLGDRLGAWMRGNAGWRRLQARVSGSILVGLGTWLALDAGAGD